MVYSSRVLALLLAICIALITTLFLSLFESVRVSALLVAFAISFSVAYLLTFVVLEFLIFREINKLYKLMDKLKKKEFSKVDRLNTGPLNPLKTINEDIYSFAELKQKEIDELKKLEAFRREFIADVSARIDTGAALASGGESRTYQPT